MRNGKGSLIGMLVLGCSMLAGGCIDAISEGAAAGINDGIAEVITNFILDAAAGFQPDED